MFQILQTMPVPVTIVVASNPACIEGSDEEILAHQEEKKRVVMECLNIVDTSTIISSDCFSEPVEIAPCSIRPGIRPVTPCCASHDLLDARKTCNSESWPIVEVILHAHPFALLVSLNEDIAEKMDRLVHG